MSGPFKLRSGNSTPFKSMGSSPVKDTNPHTGLNPPHTEHGKLEKKGKTRKSLEKIAMEYLPKSEKKKRETKKEAEATKLEKESVKVFEKEVTEGLHEEVTRKDVKKARKDYKRRKKQYKRRKKIEKFESQY